MSGSFYLALYVKRTYYISQMTGTEPERSGREMGFDYVVVDVETNEIAGRFGSLEAAEKYTERDLMRLLAVHVSNLKSLGVSDISQRAAAKAYYGE